MTAMKIERIGKKVGAMSSMKIERIGKKVVITLTYDDAHTAFTAYDDLVAQANEGRIVLEEEDGE